MDAKKQPNCRSGWSDGREASQCYLLIVVQEEDYGCLQIALMPSHQSNSAVDTLVF